jgi:uncharacterized protein YbaR (Trm112 family)
MKYRLMDLLACPICKHFPLRLIVISESRVERKTEEPKPLCELYCGFKATKIEGMEAPPCDDCYKIEIDQGVLFCESCKRWYPIIDQIPRMLPDKLRKEKEDLEFLQKNRDKLGEIVQVGLPFNLGKERS